MTSLVFLSRYPGKLARTFIVCAQKLLTLNHMTRQKFKFFDASVLIMSESVSVVSDSLQRHGLSMGQNTGVGSLCLLQRIFPTQGSNSGLLHCRWILYQLSHKESPRILEWVAYPFFLTQELNQGLLH